MRGNPWSAHRHLEPGSAAGWRLPSEAQPPKEVPSDRRAAIADRKLDIRRAPVGGQIRAGMATSRGTARPSGTCGFPADVLEDDLLELADPHGQHGNRAAIYALDREGDGVALAPGAQDIEQRQVMIRGWD